MAKFYYDLHMHSCLSPCADDDMTPTAAAGMAALNGLSIAALTDHNSCGNLPAFFAACRAYGVVPIAGMELETAEAVHVVCLFPEFSDAMAFWQVVREKYMMPFKNDATVFGEQLYMNEDDEVIGMITYDPSAEDASAHSILVVSEHGYGKRSDFDEYRKTNRGGKGVKTLNITEKTGSLVAMKNVTDDNDLIMLPTITPFLLKSVKFSALSSPIF